MARTVAINAARNTPLRRFAVVGSEMGYRLDVVFWLILALELTAGVSIALTCVLPQ